jgi:hypothetical protein
MRMNTVATVVRKALKIDSLSANTPAGKRAANDRPATHQLQFAYLPVIRVKASASATADLLDRWLQDRFAFMRAARPMPDFRDSAGALSNADRFALGHAASPLKDLQAMDIAGRAVIHLSTSCLTGPLLPVYVISLFQRRGVSLVGVNVTLGTGRQRHPVGGALHDAAPEFPMSFRHHTDPYPHRQPSWVDAVLGRFGIP